MLAQSTWCFVVVIFLVLNALEGYFLPPSDMFAFPSQREGEWGTRAHASQGCGIYSRLSPLPTETGGMVPVFEGKPALEIRKRDKLKSFY